MKNMCSDIAAELQERASNAQSLLELITVEGGRAAVSAPQTRIKVGFPKYFCLLELLGG